MPSKTKKKNKKGRKNARRGRAGGEAPSRASLADKYSLYQHAVQTPEVEVPFFDKAYRKVYRRKPLLLREDFCGTAAVSCAWAESHADRLAFAVDLDPEPLAWGRTHNLAPLQNGAKQRVELIEADVRSAETPKVDVVAAQNFSFYVFKTRPEVVSYFRVVHAHLADEGGVFVMDMFGGSEVMLEDHKEQRKFKGFRYVWDQHRFDPITHHCTFFIHFKFKDGSKLRRAFRYDWRLWSLPEAQEMLLEAGFSRSVVYWEGTDHKSGEGNGVYRKQRHAPCDPAWVCYLVGIK